MQVNKYLIPKCFVHIFVYKLAKAGSKSIRFLLWVKISTDIILKFFFFSFFPENRHWHFMQIISLWDNLHKMWKSPRRQFAWNVKAYFMEQNKKHTINLSSAECHLMSASFFACSPCIKIDIVKWHEHNTNHINYKNYTITTFCEPLRSQRTCYHSLNCSIFSKRTFHL